MTNDALSASAISPVDPAQILRVATSMRREAALWPKTERAQQTARLLNSYADELEHIAAVDNG